MQTVASPDCLPECGFVYVLGCKEGYYKIGRTRDVQRRYIQVSSSVPYRLWICYVFPVGDAPHYERWLHDKFPSSRMRGEWFKLSDADLSTLENIAWRRQDPV